MKKALEDLGGEGFEIDIERIDKRIEKVERAIYDITTSEPYVFKDYIRDKESIESYKNQLEDEYRDYKEYLKTLKKALNEILLGKGINTTWELN